MKDNMPHKDSERKWDFSLGKNPFTKCIRKAEFPKKFTHPTLPPHNGTSDPNHSLYKYEWHINAAKAMGEIKCLCFPLYLEGVASL